MTTEPTLFGTIPATPEPESAKPTDWLLAHLIRHGYVTETGITRTARIRTCRCCRTPTLAGLDDTTCALDVSCDPTPLTPIGEALALVEGRRTLALHREGNRFVLDPREREHITAYPASTRDREDVLREHRCHTPPPAGQLAAPSNYPETAPRPRAGAPAPF